MEFQSAKRASHELRGMHQTVSIIHAHVLCIYAYIHTDMCTVESLYCGHHWAKKMCPLIREVSLFQKLICTQLGPQKLS